MPRPIDNEGEAPKRKSSYAELTRKRYLLRKRAWIWTKGTAASVLVGLIAFRIRAVWPLNIFALLGLVVSIVMTWAALGNTQFVPASPEALAAAGMQKEEEPPYELNEEERAIQEALRRSARTLDRCYKWWQWSLVMAGLSAVGSVWALGLWRPEAAFVGIAGSCVAGAAAMRYFRVHGDRAAAEVTKSIERAGPELVGAVIEFIESSDASHHPMAYDALARLVKRVRPQHGPAIRPSHRLFLYRLLEPNPAVEVHYGLVLATLKMIQQLGDPRAEPYLLKLLSDAEPKEHKAVFDAANLALESIGQSEATLGQRGNLLSPAVAPAEDTLLRPAAKSIDQPPEQLLRSSDPFTET